LDLFDQCGFRRDTAPQALPTQRAEFDLRPVEPTTRLGGRMDRSWIGNALGLSGGKGFRKRGLSVRMPMVHHPAHLFHVRSMVLNQFVDNVRPIHCCPRRSDCGIPLPRSGCKSHKHVRRPVSVIRGILAQRLPRLRRERRTHFAHQRGRHCISTPLGTRRSRRLFIDLSDCFHGTDAGRRLLWGETPCLLLPRLKGMFFTVRRTVSWDTVATISTSTIVSARLRQVHRAWPSGA
jgi:hypothetical protein